VSACTATAPTFLPARPVELERVDESWAAVGMPSGRSRLVLDALGDVAGPVDVLRWACPPCWRRVQAGGTGRHLRVVRGPR
jgi:hypothetical protein